MSKSVFIVNPVQTIYPFGTYTQKKDRLTAVQVRHTLSFGSEPRLVMKEKFWLLKNLGVQHLVDLETTFEDETSIELFF